MANILMCHFEEKWVLNSNARPSIWFRYVDDTFTLFDSKDIAVLRSPFCLVMKGHSSSAISLLSNDVNVSSTYRNQTEGRALLLRKKKKKILHYLNTCHVNIKFTIELEENSAIPFLDILITRSTDHTFSRKSLIKRPRPCRFYEPARLSTPNKPLFSQNRSSAKPGLGRCYLRLCSSPFLLRSSLDEVKMLLSKNGYPRGVVNYNINDVNKPRNPTAMVRACYPPPKKKKKKKFV